MHVGLKFKSLRNGIIIFLCGTADRHPREPIPICQTNARTLLYILFLTSNIWSDYLIKTCYLLPYDTFRSSLSAAHFPIEASNRLLFGASHPSPPTERLDMREGEGH